jgi:hypothetical protein
MWSLGITMLEMLRYPSFGSSSFVSGADLSRVPLLIVLRSGGATPYAHVSDNFDVLAGVASGQLAAEIPQGCPRAVAALIRGCLQHDPQLRPSMAAVVATLRSLLAAPRSPTSPPTATAAGAGAAAGSAAAAAGSTGTSSAGFALLVPDGAGSGSAAQQRSVLPDAIVAAASGEAASSAAVPTAAAS